MKDEHYLHGDLIFCEHIPPELKTSWRDDGVMCFFIEDRDGLPSIMQRGVFFISDYSKIHKPTSLDEKLLVLFFVAEAAGLNSRELHFQIKKVLEEGDST